MSSLSDKTPSAREFAPVLVESRVCSSPFSAFRLQLGRALIASLLVEAPPAKVVDA